MFVAVGGVIGIAVVREVLIGSRLLLVLLLRYVGSSLNSDSFFAAAEIIASWRSWRIIILIAASEKLLL